MPTFLIRLILALILVPIILLLIVMGISQIVPDKPPEDFLITHNLVDLNQIDNFSRFRSCAGHRSIEQYTKEPNSSMANYVEGKSEFNGTEKVKIFAPFDGYVTHSLEFDGFAIVPKSSWAPWWPFNQWRINIDHGQTLPQFSGTAPIKAGELIGYNKLEQKGDKSKPISFDFRLAVMAMPPRFKDGNGEPYKKMDSVFRYMSDEVFAQYKAAIPGLQSTEDFVVPLTYRQSHPCQYQNNQGPYFMSADEDQNITKFGNRIFVGVPNDPAILKKKAECRIAQWREGSPSCGIK